MPKVVGKPGVDRYFATVPGLVEKVLRGAARAGAQVIADEAKERSISHEVSEAVVTRSKVEPGRIVVRISVKNGWPRSVATWLEYGTTKHFIRVHDEARAGRSVGRINRLLKENDGQESLVINGRFVGQSVLHPGARRHPFLRPALDNKEREAVAMAQSYINSHVRAGRIVAEDQEDGA